MRAAAAIGALALVGCVVDRTPPDTCTRDEDCAGQVCARSHECVPADQLHAVTVRWTIAGAAPTTTTCAPVPNFELQFRDGSDPTRDIAYHPVPCSAGAFPIDKWPLAYDAVAIQAESPSGGSTSQTGVIPPDAIADVTVDVAIP